MDAVKMIELFPSLREILDCFYDNLFFKVSKYFPRRCSASSIFCSTSSEILILFTSYHICADYEAAFSSSSKWWQFFADSFFFFFKKLTLSWILHFLCVSEHFTINLFQSMINRYLYFLAGKYSLLLHTYQTYIQQ